MIVNAEPRRKFLKPLRRDATQKFYTALCFGSDDYASIIFEMSKPPIGPNYAGIGTCHQQTERWLLLECLLECFQHHVRPFAQIEAAYEEDLIEIGTVDLPDRLQLVRAAWDWE